jgi:hypothetical protein
MLSLIILPENVIFPQVRLSQRGTRVGETVGERVFDGVSVIVGDSVTVGESVGVGVTLGVLVKSGVGEGVKVAVLVGVGVGEKIGEGVWVGVEGVQVDGGTVTWMATLTKTVRELWAVMGSGGESVLDRERKGTILGTIGKKSPSIVTRKRCVLVGLKVVSVSGKLVTGLPPQKFVLTVDPGPLSCSMIISSSSKASR